MASDNRYGELFGKILLAIARFIFGVVAGFVVFGIIFQWFLRFLFPGDPEVWAIVCVVCLAGSGVAGVVTGDRFFEWLIDLLDRD